MNMDTKLTQIGFFFHLLATVMLAANYSSNIYLCSENISVSIKLKDVFFNLKCGFLWRYGGEREGEAVVSCLAPLRVSRDAAEIPSQPHKQNKTREETNQFVENEIFLWGWRLWNSTFVWKNVDAKWQQAKETITILIKDQQTRDSGARLDGKHVFGSASLRDVHAPVEASDCTRAGGADDWTIDNQGRQGDETDRQTNRKRER